jgi:hypothetical protein
LSQLPDFLAPYFWDVNFARLRLPKRQTYVIERVLEYGGDQAIRWLKETFPPETLADVVRRSRRLSPNTANLWALVLDIPRDQIQCLSIPFPPMPGNS